MVATPSAGRPRVRKAAIKAAREDGGIGDLLWRFRRSSLARYGGHFKWGTRAAGCADPSCVCDLATSDCSMSGTIRSEKPATNDQIRTLPYSGAAFGPNAVSTP